MQLTAKTQTNASLGNPGDIARVSGSVKQMQLVSYFTTMSCTCLTALYQPSSRPVNTASSFHYHLHSIKFRFLGLMSPNSTKKKTCPMRNPEPNELTQKVHFSFNIHFRRPRRPSEHRGSQYQRYNHRPDHLHMQRRCATGISRGSRS